MTSIVVSKNQEVVKSCKVHLLHLQVQDVAKKIDEVFFAISDVSWIEKLLNKDSAKISYRVAAQKTIKALGEGIFKNHGGALTEDVGEYIISVAAIDVLERELSHLTLPISELWKEKTSRNHGFDFHSRTPENILVFGEAKYSSNSSSYGRAYDQIIDFIAGNKDEIDLVHLENFVGVFPIERFKSGFKAYSAAFALKGKNPGKAMLRASRSKKLKPLLNYSEIYIIGVEFLT